ncbi:hypothetical protein TWF506_005460 [Arthrobotrys conoides]|uniref:Uncharacterized protein n=1 Tax=Arthrobotrys conoides TaxID=74498 RepID=A0AAN8NBV8_9PEZI
MDPTASFLKEYIFSSTAAILDCAIQNIIAFMFDEQMLCPLTLNYIGLTAKLKREEILFRSIYLRPHQKFFLNTKIIEKIRLDAENYETFNRLFKSLDYWGLGISHWNLIAAIKKPTPVGLCILPKTEHYEPIVLQVVAQNEDAAAQWVNLG